MAAVAPPADQATDLLQKLSLESQPKAVEIPDPVKKPSANQFGSVDSTAAANGERSLTPLLTDFMDPSVCYIPNAAAYPQAYYYGSYDGTGNEWDDYSRYMNSDGVDMTSGIYGDNGSVMYHGYGYPPYAPYSPAGSPVPTMGNDGQLYGPQHYQYPAPYFQPMTPTCGTYTPTLAPQTQGDISTSVAADQKPLTTETANVKPNGVANGNVKGNANLGHLKPTYQSSTTYNSNGTYSRNALQGGFPASPYQDPKYYYDGARSPIPWLDASIFSDGQSRPAAGSAVSSNSTPNGPSSRNPNLSPNSHYMGLQYQRPMSSPHGYVNRMHPNKIYGQYGNALGSGMGYGSSAYGSRANGRGWYPVDNKFKPRGRGNGYFGYVNENMDGLNELNRGPRARGSKNQKGFVPATSVKGQSAPSIEEKDNSGVTPDHEQYNRADFAEEYADAKFFIIKSYSEDDVHKSIKYNVWASTPNGNKKLDAAYREAQEKPGGCPIFLLFSVNTSGQFVGLAEMVGPVDFNKNCEYWQQDKWNGCFSVKWHIVKDVPNSLLKHITLENNENKPVTNSRDTQEVKLEQGLKIIKIFKDHSSKTCILDDFGFYETRQKTIQEKKAKQQQFQKQVWEGKTVEEKKEGTNGELKVEESADLSKEQTPSAMANGDLKLPERVTVAQNGDVSEGAKPVSIIANGVASGC